MRADDILILASDGLSDNLWDEDVLDEVIKFRRNFLESAKPELAEAASTKANDSDRILRRKALAGMLSEALCSRARKVSEKRWTPKSSGASTPADGFLSAFSHEEADEVPFARRAREAGRVFRGGKQDGKRPLVCKHAQQLNAFDQIFLLLLQLSLQERMERLCSEIQLSDALHNILLADSAHMRFTFVLFPVFSYPFA